MLSDICIKQVKPTKFNFTICCSIMLNEDDSDDAAKMVEQTLREVYSQKIDIDSIDCEFCDCDDDDE